MARTLKDEFQYFLDHQAELARLYMGKYLVIKDGRVLGAYASLVDAYVTTSKTEQVGTFLIQLCNDGPDCYTQRFHSNVSFAARPPRPSSVASRFGERPVQVAGVPGRRLPVLSSRLPRPEARRPDLQRHLGHGRDQLRRDTAGSRSARLTGHRNGQGADRVVNQYIVNLKCPNRLMFVGVHVTEGQIAGDRDVLIGMDIIGEGDFAVSQDAGATLFSYRHPAVEPIDFVKQVSSSPRPAPVRSGAVPGRNHPCPCGSGKKFKACCGR